MIDPGELHRYFMVREIATGREMWVMGGDLRYTLTGQEYGQYRIDRDGEYFLAEPTGPRYPWDVPLRLEEVEPLPDGRGLYGGTPDYLKLAMNYEGSWRQAADAARGIRFEHYADAGDGQRSIVAMTAGSRGKCRYVGTLRWSASDGIVSGVGVEPKYRRRGVATRMWQLAHGNGPDFWPHPQHPRFSPVFTADGRAWSATI